VVETLERFPVLGSFWCGVNAVHGLENAPTEAGACRVQLLVTLPCVFGDHAARAVRARIGAAFPGFVAVDAEHIYWTNGYSRDTASIGRANLDGSGVNQNFVNLAGESPYAIAVPTLPAPPQPVVNIDWVPVGNPGNAPDTASNCLNSRADCGSVPYTYYISKYDTTNAQYAGFLDAVDPGGSNSLGLWHPRMGTDLNNGGISFVPGNASGSKYVVNYSGGFAGKPVTYANFYDALRFANWLNNGQGNSSTETGAYTLLGGTPIPSNGLTVTRNGGDHVPPERKRVV